jgi:hypothetical protein
MLPSSSARETALSYRQLAPILKIVFASSYYKQLASHEDRAGAGGFFWNTKHGQRLGVEVHLFNEWGGYNFLGQWLLLNYDCHERSSQPYHSIPYQARYRQIGYLVAFVDAKQKRVVEFQPAGETTKVVGKPTFSRHTDMDSNCPLVLPAWGLKASLLMTCDCRG